MALKDPEHLSQTMVMHFHHLLHGFNVDTPMEFKGTNVGEIRSIGIRYNKKRHEFVLPMTTTLYPTRFSMGIRDDSLQYAAEDVRTQFDVLVKNDTRAQLRGASLLMGQQFVNLDFIDTAEREKAPLRFDTCDHDGTYVFPTAGNPTSDIEAQIAGIARKLNRVPFEQIGQGVHHTLTTLDATLRQTEQLTKTVNSDLAPQMKETLAEMRHTLDSARQVFSDDAPLQRNARNTLEQVTKVAASMRVLTGYLNRHLEALIRGKARGA